MQKLLIEPYYLNHILKNINILGRFSDFNRNPITLRKRILIQILIFENENQRSALSLQRMINDKSSQSIIGFLNFMDGCGIQFVILLQSHEFLMFIIVTLISQKSFRIYGMLTQFTNEISSLEEQMDEDYHLYQKQIFFDDFPSDANIIYVEHADFESKIQQNHHIPYVKTGVNVSWMTAIGISFLAAILIIELISYSHFTKLNSNKTLDKIKNNKIQTQQQNLNVTFSDVPDQQNLNRNNVNGQNQNIQLSIIFQKNNKPNILDHRNQKMQTTANPLQVFQQNQGQISFNSSSNFLSFVELKDILSGINNVTPIVMPFNQIHVEIDNSMNFIQSSIFKMSKITTHQKSEANKRRKLIDLDIEKEDNIAKQEKTYYEQRYNIGHYKEMPFCVVVPTYNNLPSSRYLRNIKSIVIQDYKNYHIVVIDDASTDKTGNLINLYLKSQKKVTSNRFQVIINQERKLALANLRIAAKYHCRPQQIFLTVDGDDELMGRQVLKLFNAVFQEKKLWFIYSNYLTVNGQIGFSRAIPQTIMRENLYRTFPFIFSHLRAFYTKLFLNIKDADLKDEKGQYFRAANDVAICLPIVEQAHERVGYLPELTYFYNSDTGQNNHRLRLKEQKYNEKYIRNQPSYQSLTNLSP